MVRFAKAGLGVVVAALGVAGMSSSANAVTIYGVTPDNTLFNFDSATPGTINSGLAMSGFVSLIMPMEFSVPPQPV